MADIKRIKKVINWLIFNEFAENEAGIALKLGYTKSSLSQILNGKVPISDRFIEKLCEADSNINKVWLTHSKGEMLKNYQNIDADQKKTIIQEDLIDKFFLQLYDKNKELVEMSNKIGFLEAENKYLRKQLAEKNVNQLEMAVEGAVCAVVG